MSKYEQGMTNLVMHFVVVVFLFVCSFVRFCYLLILKAFLFLKEMPEVDAFFMFLNMYTQVPTYRCVFFFLFLLRP
jgi:hypothetical protein